MEHLPSSAIPTVRTTRPSVFSCLRAIRPAYRTRPSVLQRSGAIPPDATPNGAGALNDNTTGDNNTATGSFTLFDATGDANTATGSSALHFTTTGGDNTATGVSGSRITPPATPIWLWASTPVKIRQPAAITSTLAQGWLGLLARATPVTSRASLGKRLAAEPLSSLTQPVSSGLPLPQGALRNRSSRWANVAKVAFALKPVSFLATKRKSTQHAYRSWGS